MTEENKEIPLGDAAAIEVIDEANVKSKKKTKKILIIILLLALSICGGIATYLIMSKNKKTKQAEEKHEEVKVKTAFYDMDEIIVNLNTNGRGVGFLKLRLALEVSKASDIKALEELMPKIQDALQLYLRELRPSDLQGSVGLYRLREEMLLRINKVVYPAQVNDILFKDVLVQ